MFIRLSLKDSSLLEVSSYQFIMPEGLLKYIVFRLFFAIYLFVLVTPASAQDPAVDSLKNLLEEPGRTEGEQVEMLMALLKILIDNNDRLKYGRELFDLDYDTESMIQANISLGSAYKFKGSLDLAMQHYSKALELGPTGETKAKVNWGLALCFSAINDKENTKFYNYRALEEESLREKFPISYATVSLNFGFQFYQWGEYDSAFYFYQEARPIFDSLNRENLVAYCIGNTALVYWKIGELDRAIDGLSRAIETLLRWEDNYAVAEFQIYLGSIYYEQANYEKALSILAPGEALAQKEGLVEQIRDASKLLHDLYARKSQHDSAYVYLTQYIVMRDSLAGEKTVRDLANQRANLEINLKQAEIDVLNVKRRNQLVIGISVVLLVAILIFVSLKNASNRKQKIELELKVQEATEGVLTKNKSLSEQQQLLSRAISETHEVVGKAAESGDFSARIALDAKEGEWLRLAQSINQLFDAIVQPLDTIGTIIGSLSQGNLNLRFEEDAKGDMLILKDQVNQSLSSLSQLIINIQSSTSSIVDAATEMQVSSEEMGTNIMEVSTSISEISSGMNIQVTKVDDASGRIENLHSSATMISKQADSIKNKSQQGNAVSAEGIKVVEKLAHQSSLALEKANQATRNINDLREKSSAIANITSIIQEIATQTNMLSLNAGIQAAQAGEAGRGFSVVAREIRELADSTRVSLEEIDTLTQGVLTGTEESAKMVMEVVDLIKETKDHSAASQEAFHNLSSSYKETLDEAIQISEATNTQSEDLTEIVSNIRNIVVIAEESAAGTDQIAASCEELAGGMSHYNSRTKEVQDMLEELKKSISQFEV